jgi:DNA polymerase III subunit gamma/tau
MHLDLKYRPKKFSEVVGNSATVQLLLQLSREGKLGERSLMFGGPKGCGKTSLARIVACAVVCTELNGGEPCGECESCLGVRQESAENFEEFDAATQGSVDHMRNIVSELDYGNLNGKPSVFILDEAQRLTKQAQDAILKSIEDRRMLVILSTTEPHKIQGPLRSRLTEFPISTPPEKELETRLRQISDIEKIKISDEALLLIMKAQEYCPRTCITALDMLSITPSEGRYEISLDDVKKYFRFGAVEKLIVSLELLTTNPSGAISSISELLSSEGPSWVRDNVIIIITSAVRQSIGAKPTIVVPATLYGTRGPIWLSVAKLLGTLDKPNAADIEAILLDAVPNLPVASPQLPPNWQELIATPPRPLQHSISSSLADLVPNTISETPKISVVDEVVTGVKDEDKKVLTATPEPEKTPIKAAPVVPTPTRRIVESKKADLEIDGVNFTAHEKLTSIDDKIEKGSRGVPTLSAPADTPEVQLSKDRLPLTAKEFSRGFSKRIKNSGEDS